MREITMMQGESVKIGDDVEIVAVSIEGDFVRLGVTPPKSMTVLRQEVCEQTKMAEKQRAKRH